MEYWRKRTIKEKLLILHVSPPGISWKTSLILILSGLIHIHTVIAREIQITKEHMGLIQFAFKSANDFPSLPLSHCVSLCHAPLSLSGQDFYLQKLLLYSYSDSTILW